MHKIKKLMFYDNGLANQEFIRPGQSQQMPTLPGREF
jgi:hypothetical protein